MNRLWNVIKRVLGYEYETGNTEYNDLLLKEKKNSKPIDNVYAGDLYDENFYGKKNNYPYLGSVVTGTIHHFNTMANNSVSIHNQRNTSYDEYGTYQYYWNEEGEYVREYLGGINNSKL